MSEKDLSKYYWLNKEIKDLEDKIKELGDGVGSIKYGDTIKGIGGKHSSIQEKIVELKSIWMERRISSLEEYIKIEKYIAEIDDTEIRTIMNYRFKDLKSWDEIGILMDKDRTTVAKKMRKYLKNSPNSHK